MIKTTCIPTISVIFIFAILLVTVPACADDIEGAPTGWWTDSEGNNHYGDPPSQSSSSSSSASSGSSNWAAAFEARREAAAIRKENARKQKAYDLNQKGIEFSSQNNFEKALEYYKKAAEVAPEDQVIQGNVLSVQGNMWNQKGMDYYAQNDMVNAKKMFELALTFRPDDPTITANLNDTQTQLNTVEQENLKKQETEQQTNQVRSKLADYSQELKSRSAETQPQIGLDFKDTVSDSADSHAPKVPLEGFKNMKPVTPALIKRGEMPQGGSATVSGQAIGLTKSGATAVIGSKIGDGEMGAQGAGIGFDTPGAASPGLEPFKLKGIQRENQDPDIPQERIPEFKGLVEKREAAREKRKDLEGKLEKMEQDGSKNPAEIVKMRDQIDQFKNEENFVNFSIKDKLAKAPQIKK